MHLKYTVCFFATRGLFEGGVYSRAAFIINLSIQRRNFLLEYSFISSNHAL